MTNLQRFKDLIQRALKDGGLTAGLGEKDYLIVKSFVKGGYMVGGFSDEYKSHIKDIIKTDADGLYTIMTKLHRQAAAAAGFSMWEYTKDLYLGFWVDEKTNELYMEVSKNFTSKKAALKEAAARKQLAIYDIKNHKSIYL